MRRRGGREKGGLETALAAEITTEAERLIGDGAPWVWNIADELFPDAIQIVVLFHAKERVWEVAHTIYGKGTDLAAQTPSSPCDAQSSADASKTSGNTGHTPHNHQSQKFDLHPHAAGTSRRMTALVLRPGPVLSPPPPVIRAPFPSPLRKQVARAAARRRPIIPAYDGMMGRRCLACVRTRIGSHPVAPRRRPR